MSSHRDDERIARALQIRIDLIDEEMRAAADQRTWAYELADEMLNEGDQLAEERFRLSSALWRVENRLAAAAFRQNREAAE